MKKQRLGFVPVAALIVIGVVLIASGAYYFVGKSKISAPEITYNNFSTSTASWKTYIWNGAVSFKYPEDWTVKDEYYRTPVQEINGDPASSVGISIYPLNAPTVLEDYIYIGGRQFDCLNVQNCKYVGGVPIHTVSKNQEIINIYSLIADTIKNSAAQYPEDGSFTGYITKAYDKNYKKYIDIDYFETLREKAAVLKVLNGSLSSSCFAKYPTPTKAEILAQINNLKDDSTFNEQFRLLSNQNDGVACFPEFPNGIWLDSNENSKIRTFEVRLDGPILAAYVREEFGFHKMKTEGDAGLYEITWDTFKNIIAGVNYKIPFGITVSENQVIKIGEIYRP